jgi:hypothetical protein
LNIARLGAAFIAQYQMTGRLYHAFVAEKAVKEARPSSLQFLLELSPVSIDAQVLQDVGQPIITQIAHFEFRIAAAAQHFLQATFCPGCSPFI